MTGTRQKCARAYWSLRSAHLERAQELPDAAIIYGKANYDFDESLAVDLELLHAPSASSVAQVVRASRELEILEVNEPLGLDSLPWTLAALTAARVSARLQDRRVRVVSYAIENRDPFEEATASTTKARVRKVLERMSSRHLVKHIDRIAFGTDGSAATYRRRFANDLPDETTVIPALPTTCSCLTSPQQSGQQLIFVGALTTRKGFDVLLRCWPAIATELPNATLVIIGKGVLEPEAATLAAADPRVRLLIDPPREAIHEQLRFSNTLILMSQRTNRWREQVGLPIVEALAHGVQVVTTTETGLADWLSEHGHQTLAPDSTDTEVIAAVVRSLQAAPASDEVLASLPLIDGRLAADEWLFTSSGLPTQPR